MRQTNLYSYLENWPQGKQTNVLLEKFVLLLENWPKGKQTNLLIEKFVLLPRKLAKRKTDQSVTGEICFVT